MSVGKLSASDVKITWAWLFLQKFFEYRQLSDINCFTLGERLIQVLWPQEFALPIERTKIVEEDAALLSWYVEKLDVFTYFLTDCGKIDDRLISNHACVWTSSDAARWILSKFEQNSFNAWSSRFLRLEARPGNGRSISPIFIESLSSSSSIGSLSDVKFVSTKVSLVRQKDEKCETSLLRVVFWYHLLSLMVSGLKPAWSSASVNRSGFITSSLNSWSTLCLEEARDS